MERKNSKNQRKSTPDRRGFFMPGHFYGREGDGYNTRKGKKSA